MTVAALLLLTGCGRDTPAPAADPSPTSAATPSAAPSQTATPTEIGVAPADGVAISSELAQVNAPGGWGSTPSSTATGGNVNGPDGNARYNLALVDAASDYPDDSTDYAATLSQKSCCYQPPLERQPDLTLAGQPAYHLAGDDSIFGGWADEYGLRYQGHIIKVIIRTPRDLAPAKRESIAAGVLASFQLTA